MRRLLRVIGPLALASSAFVVGLASPAGAQQLVDVSEQGKGAGGLAFVLFTVMVVACAGAMFFMDHVRRDRLRRDEDAPD